jgi:menaquinol-cytochrome c reductase iron-sulfur subunit
MDDVPSVETSQSEGTTRRGFYIGAIYGMMAVVSAALGIPALLYLFTPAKAKKPDAWAEGGDTTRLTPNSPVEIVFHRDRIDGWRTIAEKGTAWVVKYDDGHVVAFGPNCTHLGCAYHWEAGTPFSRLTAKWYPAPRRGLSTASRPNCKARNFSSAN